MALGAIPVVANAADVQTISSDVLASTDGNEVKYSVGKLVPGKYNFTAQVLSKVYGVQVKIGGKTQTIADGNAAQDVNIEFTLTQETNVELTLVSTDPGESGAGFTVSGAKVILDYNFATIKSELADNADALAAIIAGYNYAAKQEDVDAANALKTKAQGVAESYDDYKKFKLYAQKSTIQEEIDALAESAAAKEAAYQNEQAYNRVNAAVTTIKNKYNAAVADLEEALVGAAAYLLDGAKAELNTEINLKITEATQASYASYQAGTAVADEADNTALIPTEEALTNIVNNWTGQGTANQNAYDALHKKVTDLQAALDAVVPAEAIASLFPKTEAQAAIDAVNTKVEAAKNSAAQLTLNVNTEEATAQGKITELAGKVNTANAEYTANEATKTTIEGLQTNLNNAKTTVNALKYGDASVESYYTAYVAGVQGEIDAFSNAAATAYKADGTGTAQTYNANLDVTATQAKIDAYKTKAKEAVDKYDALQAAINTAETGYQAKLDAARAEFEGLVIYEAEGYDYKTKLDLIQKRINDIKKAITAAQGKVGADHWTAMLAINADAAILTDIETLLSEKQAKQDQYDQNFLGNGLDDLDTRIAAFNTNATNAKLGADYQVFVDAETAIAAKVTDIKSQKDAITPGAEGAAAAIQALGAKTTKIQAEQTALETAAAEIAAKVADTGAKKTALATNISNLQTKIGTFKTTYKIGQDDSTLGNRGKAGGSITTEVGEIETALGTLATNNGNIDATSVDPVEKIEAAVTGLTIGDLENGIYDVKYKIGDDAEQTLNNVLVTDGTLTIDAVIPEGKTASITKLTYHENSKAEEYTKNSGFNAQYTALAAQENALEAAAPGIKTAVENNATAKTAADNALTALGTFEIETLKNLKDVSDPNGDFSTSGSNPQNAKKADPQNWAVFRSGLANDKNYQAKKNAIDATIGALTGAIADAFAAETLPYPWADEITVVTEDDPATADVNEASSITYKISEIKETINALKAEAGDESDNYWGYRNTSKAYFNVNINAADIAGSGLGNGTLDKEFPQAITDLAAIEQNVGQGAEPYYSGLIISYKDERVGIITRMIASLNARTAVADNSGYVNELRALVNKVKAIKANATANLAKYNEQKPAAAALQTLWNSTYTEIAALDHSSQGPAYLQELDAIQVTLTAATDAIETNYVTGKSVENAQDLAAIEAAINDVKARQAESYNAYVTADNKAAHESFMGNETTKGTIQLATEAYQKAVQERAQYSVSNADIKAVVDAAAAALDEALYNCPDAIQALTTAENEAYAATVSPTVFDVHDFNAQATAIEQNITNALATFKAEVKDAIQNSVWTPKKNGYTAKVTAAENAIADYSSQAKTDAFKDVKKLIADGDAAVAAVDLVTVESTIEALENIDALLAADKDAAAVKDLTPRLTEAETKYTDVKSYINGVTNNIAEKATQLQNLEDAYEAIADEKALDKTFANRDIIKNALDGFNTAANNCKTAVENAVAADNANTAAYGEMTTAIDGVKAKLAEAKAAAAPYKYATSFETDEANLAGLATFAADCKAAGSAVANKADVLADAATISDDVETTLVAAFGTEQNGLVADITELKNQYNAYVAANGLNETATAFKADIDDLEGQLSNIEFVDADDPADGIQFDEMLAGTAAMVKLQNDIADKETELLAANADGANANVLASFTEQLDELAGKASLEGNDAWVGEQTVGGKKISESIAEIQGQIADVKAAIQAEANISFYKDQYQAQIDAIEDALTPVTEAIAAKQAQFTANAEAYATLSVKLAELQGKVDAAKEKVSAYEFAANYYIWLFEYDWDEDGVLDGGIQKDINDATQWLETANTNVALNAGSNVDLLAANVEATVQQYLDESANAELDNQRWALSDALVNAIDAKYQAQKFSSALWARLIAEKNGINDEIIALSKAIYTSNQNYEGSFEVETESSDWTDFGQYFYTLDAENNRIVKDRTSDADYAAQMEIVKAIKAEIETLATAVDDLNLLGDANIDGKVNVLDYQKVVNMILDPSLQPEEESDLFANLDINQSSVIEVGDLTAVVYYILNDNWQGWAAAPSLFQTEVNESLSMTQDTKRIAINLENANSYTAFQMDLVLPDGMKIVGTSLSNRAGESHKLYSRNQMDGSIRLLASSVKGETFSGNEGAVLYIDVETTSEYMGGKAELLNILFSDTNAQTRSFTIGGETTGIDTVGTFEALKQMVYDLGGRLKNGVKKGLNIIRNADGSTKKVMK